MIRSYKRLNKPLPHGWSSSRPQFFRTLNQTPPCPETDSCLFHLFSKFYLHYYQFVISFLYCIIQALTWSSWLSPLGSWTLASRRWFCSSLVCVPRISLSGKFWKLSRMNRRLLGPVNAIILPFWLSHLRKPLCSQAVIRNWRHVL